MKDRQFWFSTIAAILFAIAFIVIYLFGPNAQFSALALGLVGIAMLLFYLSLTAKLVSQNPTPLVLAIVGYPNSGKTVYLTSLFERLERSDEQKVQFAPYGVETIERVHKDLGILASGAWLPKTEPNTVFYYRAIASYASLFRPRSRYKLEIADYAGEHLEEFIPDTERWMHRGDFFEYVTRAEGVLLAIDCDFLISKESDLVEKLQNDLVAAIQVLAERKGGSEIKRPNMPLALIFMKSDLLKKQYTDTKKIILKIPRLIDVCKRRFSNFQVFFVSSVGTLGVDGKPPPMLMPEGVVEPLAWILQRYKFDQGSQFS